MSFSSCYHCFSTTINNKFGCLQLRIDWSLLQELCCTRIWTNSTKYTHSQRFGNAKTKIRDHSLLWTLACQGISSCVPHWHIILNAQFGCVEIRTNGWIWSTFQSKFKLKMQHYQYSHWHCQLCNLMLWDFIYWSFSFCSFVIIDHRNLKITKSMRRLSSDIKLHFSYKNFSSKWKNVLWLLIFMSGMLCIYWLNTHSFCFSLSPFFYSFKVVCFLFCCLYCDEVVVCFFQFVFSSWKFIVLGTRLLV